MDDKRGGGKMETARIDYKPLSVNKCWLGRRRKSADYRDYEQALMCLLPSEIDIPEGKLKVSYTWGFSSKLADLDNPIKPFQDILQNFYQFNDRDIWELTVKKELVKKGEEFIEFLIEEL